MMSSPREQRLFRELEEKWNRVERAFRNKPAENLARHVSPICSWLTIHPVDRATGLHVMFACCVEASQRTVIALLETCQITATTRG